MPRSSSPTSRIARQHAEWLSLLEISGPFLSPPVLKERYPQGLPQREDESDHVSNLRQAYDEWQSTMDERQSDQIHQAWILFVLRRTLEFDDSFLRTGADIQANLEARVSEQQETLRPDIVIVHPEDSPDSANARLLIQIVRPTQDLEKPLAGHRWKASPATRMTELLRGQPDDGCILGLVTNGERWMLVHAPRGETTGYASWYGHLWLEERITLRSFRELLGIQRFFGVDLRDTLDALLKESARDQFEVTEQLGKQVREAVEILVQTVDRIDRARHGSMLRSVDEHTLYDAAVTVMMRLVFMFYAEEQDLLPLGDPFYDQNYAISTLHGKLQDEEDRLGPEVIEHRHSAWNRLLATFRAVHGGVDHERMRLPAYGGSLFDPDRFPFLEGREIGTCWRETPADPIPIDDRTVLHLLTSLQFLGTRGFGGVGEEARRLSFKALGVEQIGYVYEGLLDHGAVRADGPVLGLVGKKDAEPEVPLYELERRAADSREKLFTYLKETTKKTEKYITKAIGEPVDTGDPKWNTACENDGELLERIGPYSNLIREDTRGYPVVIPDGSVYVTQSSSRRSSGTYYTPPSLTEPIVKHTLDPLIYQGPAEGKPEEDWVLCSPKRLLSLKICDLAMGSGAFLVQACRYMSERLVEGWEEIESKNPGKVVITPEGDLSNGDPQERPIPKDLDERMAIARRTVADRCLYGVDKNPMAVEMAKLSMWLMTLQRGKPFTFLDHALKCGDSLLGVTHRNQLECFDLDPREGTQIPLFGSEVQRALSIALEKRKALESFPVNDVRDAEEKAKLLEDAENTLDNIRLAGDLLVGAAMASSGKRNVYENNRATLSGQFGKLLSEKTKESEISSTRNRLEPRAYELLNGGRPFRETSRRPFHWVLEFHEVFERGGFDAFVGNPPFQGGQKITGALGTDYRDFLVDRIAGGTRGSADLCAYMFLRAASLLRVDGGFGLLATNTIAQGDTREVGLDRLLNDGCSIIRAVSSQKWPGEANLAVAVVWLHKGDWGGRYNLDAKLVGGITPYLSVPGRVQGKPYRLAANANKSFQGSIVLGMGFILRPEEAQALIRKDSRNKDVLFLYLNGEDLNSRWDQSPSRWVINFRDWPKEKALEYPDCFKIIEEKVRPERAKLIGRNPISTRRGENWWLYASNAKTLYSTIKDMNRVMVIAETTKYCAFSWCSTDIVFSHTLKVIASDCYGVFGLLNSCFHEIWTRKYSSTLENRLKYTPSDSFETYPFPSDLDTINAQARSFEKARLSMMKKRKLGITKVYNLVSDPSIQDNDVLDYREQWIMLDQAVAKAYGWEDIEFNHDFGEFDRDTRFTISKKAREELLDRLLELNHEIHGRESELGCKRITSKPKRRAHQIMGGQEKSKLPLFNGDAGKKDWRASRGDTAESAIMECLKSSYSGLTKSEILSQTLLHEREWRLAIKDLLSSGRVIRTGERRGTRYSAASIKPR